MGKIIFDLSFSKSICIKFIILTGLFLGICNYSVGQDQADSLWSYSQIRTDINADDTLDFLGQQVTITGIANIETGLLHEHYLQAFVQNDSAGMSIFAMDIDDTFKPGDSLIATGKIQRYNGLTEVHVDSYRVFRGVSEEPEPEALEKAVQNPQKYLGMLVEGNGKIVEKGNIYNGKYFQLAPSDTANSTIMIYVSNFHHLFKKFDFDVLSIGDEVSVKGIMSEYNPDFPENRTFKVFLRTPEDLEYASLPQYYLFVAIGGLILLTLVVVGWIVMMRWRIDNKTEEIQKSLNEKEVLLREIHHRVKNSLAIVSGLIGMQMEATDSNEAQDVLQDSQSRIQSVGLIHEKLYQTESLSDIRLDNYLKDLVGAIHSTFTEYNDAVDLRFDLEPVDVDVDKVIPCGLLTNELVVNAFKHAFQKDRQGILEIKLYKEDSNVILTIADNGPGIPEDFNFNGGDSLGSMLISTFAAQLEAQTEIESGKDGAAFTFTFSKN